MGKVELTKEMIEECRATIGKMISDWCVDETHEQHWKPKFEALCDLALERLAVTPRPIEEADKLRSDTEHALLWLHHINEWREGSWDNDARAWVDDLGRILNPSAIVFLPEPSASSLMDGT
jgi:hypothetical protein